MICIIGTYHVEEKPASQGVLDGSEPGSPPAEGVPLRHRYGARPPGGRGRRPGTCRRMARRVRRLLRRGARGLHQAAAARTRRARYPRLKYLLDTATCISALKQNAAVLVRLFLR